MHVNCFDKLHGCQQSYRKIIFLWSFFRIIVIYWQTGTIHNKKCATPDLFVSNHHIFEHNIQSYRATFSLNAYYVEPLIMLFYHEKNDTCTS